MYKYVLFDLDGTLTDSALGITNCIIYVCEKMNLTVPSMDVLKTFVGPPLTKRFSEVFSLSEEDAKKALSIYRERFAPIGIFENQVYLGVSDMLKALKDSGCVIALATSKPQIFAEQILKHFKLDTFFDYVSGSDLTGGKQEKTDVMKEALSNMKAEKEKTVMVGDRSFDIEGAKELNVKSIAVTYGYGTMEEIDSCKPDYVADTPGEVAEIILKGE